MTLLEQIANSALPESLRNQVLTHVAIAQEVNRLPQLHGEGSYEALLALMLNQRAYIALKTLKLLV